MNNYFTNIQLNCLILTTAPTGLEIVTDMLANATKTLTLTTKNSSVVGDYVPLIHKRKNEEQFLKSRFCFSAKRKCKLTLHRDCSRQHYSGFYMVIAGAIFC